jgi:SAM-dependent methyltransferase
VRRVVDDASDCHGLAVDCRAYEEEPINSSQWDERYGSADLVWSATPNRWVEQLTADLPVGRALDLAGGEGRNALWLADRGWQAIVVDLSEVALDRVRGLAAKRFGANDQRVSTLRADVRTYQPPPGSFDLVLLVYLHVPADDRRTVVRSAASAVAPGGRLLVVAHDSKNLEGGFGGPQDARLLYTAEDVAADLVGTSLAIERSEAVVRTVVIDGGPRDAIDAVLMAVNAPTATKETEL